MVYMHRKPTAFGNDNVADGFYAAYSTKGNSNVAIGSHALYLNTTGNNLVAIGDSALLNLDGGFYNTSVGSKALYSKQQPLIIPPLAYNALYSNVTGTQNTAVGFNSMLTNTGSNNSSLGAYAGYYPSTAQVQITNADGKLLKTVFLSGSGKGTLNVDASILSAGAYHYSLYVDNKLISTKKMLVAK